MPPTAKRYKAEVPKTESDVSMANKQSDDEAETPVVSGQLKRAIRNKRNAPRGKRPFKSTRGVVFVKNLPHGFFEEQLEKYFQQFGHVTRVRLARSLRTGGSKGFAFVEFAVPQVAEIAAETMNNYLMFRKIVKASYIPPEQQKYNYFRTSVRKVMNKHGKEKYVSSKTRAITRKVREINNWNAENYAKRIKHTESKLQAFKRKFGDLDYDVDALILGASSRSTEESQPAEEDNASNGVPAAKKQKKKTSESSDASAPGSSRAAKASQAAKEIHKTNGVPVTKKQKKKANTSESSVGSRPDSSGVDASSAQTSASSTNSKSSDKKPSKKAKQAQPLVALEQLLDSTLAGDSSDDEDFIPDDTFGSTTDDDMSADSEPELPAPSDDESENDEESGDEESDNEEQSDNEEESDEEESESAKSSPRKPVQRGADTSLGQLLADTIADDSSDDEDFDPEEEADDDEGSDEESLVASSCLSSEDELDDEESDSSPQKPTKKMRQKSTKNVPQNNLATKAHIRSENLVHRKPHAGGIKKNKSQKHVKSQALQQKIQEAVKSMALQKNFEFSKAKDLKKIKNRRR